ncbi:hypothetical protein ACFS5L_34430 [Streptomyces phyllanthi]|nr:hypothetical protein [Streptomyces phyllanthi]
MRRRRTATPRRAASTDLTPSTDREPKSPPVDVTGLQELRGLS